MAKAGYQFVSFVSYGSVEVARASEVDQSTCKLAVRNHKYVQPPMLQKQ